MLTVATWNVLHRIHGENWGEEVTRRWPDEAERIAAISRHVAQVDAQVIALQEVSGDQLASLRALPRTVLSFRYPRVPAPRGAAARSPLREPDEFLVLLVDGPATTVGGEAFASDPGKGLLAARVAAFTVITVHVTFGAPAASQLRRVADFVAAAPGPAIVLGDFNTELATTAAMLGAGFTALAPTSPLPSRPRPAGATKATTIDHVFVHGGTLLDVAVHDVGGLSDHNLVVARIQQPT
jgi:endonuclease/exonuclease/phosphatase (EEP) superfamily protein YafD